jgi:hypothetical protein
MQQKNPEIQKKKKKKKMNRKKKKINDTKTEHQQLLDGRTDGLGHVCQKNCRDG